MLARSTNGLVVIPPRLSHALISFLQKAGVIFITLYCVTQFSHVKQCKHVADKPGRGSVGSALWAIKFRWSDFTLMTERGLREQAKQTADRVFFLWRLTQSNLDTNIQMFGPGMF